MPDLPKELIAEFIDAVAQDRDRAAALLTAHPELINARWIHDETLLHFLAVEGFNDGVEFLARQGADVNSVNELGDPPLIDIVVLGNTEAAEILLRHGADPNARSATRDNPLDCAVRSGNVELVGLLLEAGADGRYTTDLGESILDALQESPDEAGGISALLAQYGLTASEG
jgi:ankyrin repeat protein